MSVLRDNAFGYGVLRVWPEAVCGGFLMDDYKVTYIAGGSEFIYGYANTLGEAIELYNECADYGWRKIKIKRWHRHQWVTINI